MQPPVSIFHQHSDNTLKYCSNVIYKSDHKLGSLRWKIGASLIRYRIIKSSKPLWKINKLTITKIYWQVLEATLKSKQPFTLSNILSPPLQLRLVGWYIITCRCHVCYISDYVYLHKLCVNLLLKSHLSPSHRISSPEHHLERTDSKPFSRLIGLTYINK